MAGSSGGGAFVIVYLFAVALFAIPILMVELMLGRGTGAFRQCTTQSVAYDVVVHSISGNYRDYHQRGSA